MEKPIEKKVDESWKDQIEKGRHEDEEQPVVEEASSEEGEAEEGPPPEQGPMEYPKAEFVTFASGLGMQEMMAMGEMTFPGQEKPAVDISQAKYLIDLLAMLEEKTKGNLDEAEEKFLTETLYVLRMKFVEHSKG